MMLLLSPRMLFTHVFFLNYSFYNCSLKSITLGPRVEIIKTCAFQDSKLEFADLSNTKLKKFQGIYHFCYTKLLSIRLPDCLEQLPHFFISYTNITEFTFPKNLKYIDDGALSCIPKLNILKSNCPDIVIYRGIAYSRDFKTLIKCPVYMNEPLAPTVISVSPCGAMSCCKFVSFALEVEIQKFGSRMFRACPFLESVDLSKSIASELPYETFYECKKLINLTLPDTLISFDYWIFGEGKITNLKIPSSVRYLVSNSLEFSDIGSIEYCGLYLLNVEAPSNTILKTNINYSYPDFMKRTDFKRVLSTCPPERTPLPIATLIPKIYPSCMHREYSLLASLPLYMISVIIIS